MRTSINRQIEENEVKADKGEPLIVYVQLDESDIH